MPRTVTSVQSQEGNLRQIILTRRADGSVSAEIIVVEVDSRDGVPEASRERIFTDELLVPANKQGLTAQFDSAETRIRQQFYS